MRPKYKFKSTKEELEQNYLTSYENLSPDNTMRSRIFVNTNKYFKRNSVENSNTKNEITKKSEISYNKDIVAKMNVNINLENKNYKQRNKINDINSYLNTINKSGTTKNIILKKFFNEEKKPFNIEYNKSQDEKLLKNNTFKYYRSNRLCRNNLNNNNNNNNYINNTEQINSIRSHSIRNLYNNLSFGLEKTNSEKNKNEKPLFDKHLQARLFKKKCFEEYRNRYEKNNPEAVKEEENINIKSELLKEKECDIIEEDNEKNIKKEKEKTSYIKEKEKNNIQKEKDKSEKEEINNETNYNKFHKNENKEENKIKDGKIKELKNLNINDNNFSVNRHKKEIQVKRAKNQIKSSILSENEKKNNFNFLIHEANQNQQILNIFNKLYDSCPNIAQAKKISESSIKNNVNNNINKDNININNNFINNDDIKNNLNINDNMSFINKTNNISNSNSNININISNNISNISGTDINNNTSNYKIKSMKSIYSFLKTHSRNNFSDSVYNLNKEKNEYKFNSNHNSNNNILQKRKSENTDDRPSLKSSISNLKYLYNYSEINSNNNRNISNSSFINSYDFPKFKVIYKNNKLNKFFKKNINEINSNEKEKEKEKEIKVENKIINNNTYNTTYNIFKINNNIIQQNPINIDFETKQKKSEFQLTSAYFNENKKYLDFEIIYILEEKLKTIINRMNKYEVCNNECYDFITCYFNHEFYEKEIDLFQIINNKNNIINIIKDEIICYFLSYEVCFSPNFNRISILLKAIFQLLHSNYLILVNFILNNNYAKFKNDDNDLLNQILNIIDKNLKIKDIINEDNVIQLMADNFRQINNYYSMIIDNIYPQNNISSSNFYSFPNCLNIDKNKLTDIQKNNIIISFFYEANKSKQNFTIQDLKKFFDSYLNRAKMLFNFLIKDNISIKNNLRKCNSNNNLNNIDNYLKPLKVNQNKNYMQINENMNINSYLPPIKKPYKYTLVLDLDETLINYQTELGKNSEKPNKNVLILRPDLILFLREMKKIFELVLFSYATYDYIEKILKIIESKEKFFEYILDRRHITYENGSYVKNLALIGRDLKNVIIIDDKPQAFKMNQDNGIFIKPFYGDCFNNKNILRNLINILKEIRKDVEITGDIRKSIQKKKHEIFTKITTGLNE